VKRCSIKVLRICLLISLVSCPGVSTDALLDGTFIDKSNIPISVTNLINTIQQGTSYKFTVTDGTKPYQFSRTRADSFIDALGNYTAPQIGNVEDQLIISDAKNQSLIISLKITEKNTISIPVEPSLWIHAGSGLDIDSTGKVLSLKERTASSVFFPGNGADVTWQNNCVNGLGCIAPNGNKILREEKRSVISGNTAITVFGVVRVVNVNNVNLFILVPDWVNLNMVAFGFDPTGPSFLFTHGDATNTNNKLRALIPAGWLGNWHIIEIYRSGSSGEIISDCNAVALTHSNFGTNSTSGTEVLKIGWDYTGEIAELIFYPYALTLAQRVSVRCTLSNRYNITANGC
jgi:hypothetical protein